MLSKSLVAASVALVGAVTVSAQSTAECTPSHGDCSANPAVGKNSISCDFTKGACPAFAHLDGKAVTYDAARGAVFEMTGTGQAPTLRSDDYIFFGRVEVEMQAAPGHGIVSTVVLMSEDGDEIDLEAIGSEAGEIQSNTFSKGDASRHDLLGRLPVGGGGTTTKSHTYTVDWTADRIEWLVDGVSRHVLRRADHPDRYPQTPCRVSLGTWVPGTKGLDSGTVKWGGGLADFSRGPSAAYYRSVSVVDYAGGSRATDMDVREYAWGSGGGGGDGSSESMVIRLADGTTTSGGKPSGDDGGSSSSSSSSSSSRTSTSAESSSSSSSTSTSAESSSSSSSSTADEPTTTSDDNRVKTSIADASSTTAVVITTTTTGASNSTMTTMATSASKTTVATSGTGASTGPSSGAAAVNGMAMYGLGVAALAALVAA